MTRRRLEGFGVTLECIVSPSIDDHSRPLAVCLHGFPDSAHTWRHLLHDLEAEGWRAAAPFLRGYAPSEVPADGCLQTAASSRDANALHEQLSGDERAVIIGHDWGAPIAYGAAGHEPERWAKVVGIAVPPGPALATAFFTNPDQLKRSWYMFFFQHAFADMIVPADDLAFIDMIWNDWSPDYDGADDAELVKVALRDPANLAAALGYYRAALSGIGARDDLADEQALSTTLPPQPLLYLHGAGDGCIGAEVAEAARADFGSTATLDMIDGVGHFLHLETPDVVNQRILEFIS